MTLTEKTKSQPVPTVPEWARERAEMIQGLYIHALMYVLINGGLLTLNWLTRPEDGAWWSLWVLAIWGIGLILHVVVAVLPVFRSEWVERRARRIAARYPQG